MSDHEPTIDDIVAMTELLTERRRQLDIERHGREIPLDTPDEIRARTAKLRQENDAAERRRSMRIVS